MDNLSTLLESIEIIADLKFEGQFTILKSKNGWKAFFGTPTLNDVDGGRYISEIFYDTLQGALQQLLDNSKKLFKPNIFNYNDDPYSPHRGPY